MYVGWYRYAGSNDTYHFFDSDIPTLSVFRNRTEFFARVLNHANRFSDTPVTKKSLELTWNDPYSIGWTIKISTIQRVEYNLIKLGKTIPRVPRTPKNKNSKPA